MTDHQFGPFGITTGLDSSAESIAAARAAEELGYPAIWLSGGPLPGLQTITDLVGATTAIKFVSGILAVVKYSAVDVSTTYAALEAAAPGRRPVAGWGARRQADRHAQRVPGRAGRTCGAPAARSARPADAEARCGPLRRSTYPFLTSAAYSAEARKVLGPDKLLAVSHLAVLETDADRARAIARDTISFFTTIPGYVSSLKRQGFSENDLSTLPDHMVDSLAAWGTPANIKSKLTEHLAAGADHVAVNVITGVTGPQPIDQWRTLAPALLA